jgi:hypothetical protein
MPMRAAHVSVEIRPFTLRRPEFGPVPAEVHRVARLSADLPAKVRSAAPSRRRFHGVSSTVLPSFGIARDGGLVPQSVFVAPVGSGFGAADANLS